MANLPPYLDELVRACAMKELRKGRGIVIRALTLAKEYRRRPMYRLVGGVRMNVGGKVANTALTKRQRT